MKKVIEAKYFPNRLQKWSEFSRVLMLRPALMT